MCVLSSVLAGTIYLRTGGGLGWVVYLHVYGQLCALVFGVV